jgi:trk system potassium uptake protein
MLQILLKCIYKFLLDLFIRMGPDDFKKYTQAGQRTVIPSDRAFNDLAQLFIAFILHPANNRLTQIQIHLPDPPFQETDIPLLICATLPGFMLSEGLQVVPAAWPRLCYNERIKHTAAKGARRMKKQFAVIGMGRFGSSVAEYLNKLGYEVLAIDENEARIQEISDRVTHAVQADSTDEDALRSLGLRNFDVVVVAIGQDVQASIMTTLILKEMNIPNIIVKATSELQGKVLAKIGADKVIFPERDMGKRVAHHLISPHILDYIELSEEHSIVEIRAGQAMAGQSLRELDIRARYNCNVMGIRRGDKLNIAPNADEKLQEQDILVIIGENANLNRFEKTMT